MGKPSTDPGLGPSSEARLKAGSARDAETQPGAVEETKPKPQRRDTVDVLLEGFEGREERPRILPNMGKEVTPTPPPPEAVVRKDLTPTAPGSRQRKKGQIVAGVVIGFLLVLGVAVLVKKLTTHDAPVVSAPIATVAVPTVTAPPVVMTSAPPETTTPAPTDTTPAPTTPVTTAKPKPSTTPTAKPTSRDPHLVIEN